MNILKIGKNKVEVPIILGGMAVEISMASLASKVANKGGVGLLPASGLTTERLVQEIRLARKLTDGFIGVNIMLAVNDSEKLSIASIREGVDLLVIGAGVLPKLIKELVVEANKHNTPIFMIVSSLKAFKIALKLGVDGVIVEGADAGGHLGTDKKIWEILPGILSLAPLSFPVVAAGGCGNREAFKKAISIGASGIQMGTNFALTKEAGQSSVSKNWQKAVLSNEIVVVESTAGMRFRVALTPAIKRLKKDGVSHILGRNPGCIENCLRKCIYRSSDFEKSFCVFEMLRLAKDGDLENGIFTIGRLIPQNLDIDNLPTVSEVIDQILN